MQVTLYYSCINSLTCACVHAGLFISPNLLTHLHLRFTYMWHIQSIITLFHGFSMVLRIKTRCNMRTQGNSNFINNSHSPIADFFAAKANMTSQACCDSLFKHASPIHILTFSPSVAYFL